MHRGFDNIPEPPRRLTLDSLGGRRLVYTSPMFEHRVRRHDPRALRVAAAVLAAVLGTGAAGADTVSVAAAANFAAAAREIGAAFTAAGGHEVTFSFGSTGQLYAQISQGAPFEVFLAADQDRPARAERDGLAVPGTRFTYATGAIVLFSADPGLVTGADTLRTGHVTKLAIANPVTAPYGHAAVETMKALGVYDTLAPRIVQGGNVVQAFQFVASGNAEVGFVSRAQLVGVEGGSRWEVPADLYPAIAQDAVLLTAGADNAAARAFLEFLRGGTAREIIAAYGYDAGN